MREICLHYREIESAIAYSVKTRSSIDDYTEEIRRVIRRPIDSLCGSDEKGFTQSAESLALKKIEELNRKKEYFVSFEVSVQSALDTAKKADKKAAEGIAQIAEAVIGKRGFFQSVGDLIYNTFCVDIANSTGVLRTFANVEKWIGHRAEDSIGIARDWFRYGDGRYLWNGVKSVLSVGKVIVGVLQAAAFLMTAVASAAAAPFTGGTSLGLFVACVGFFIASVSAVITMFNMEATVEDILKALTLRNEHP